MRATTGEVGIERARRLIGDSLVWDNHVCLPHRAEAGWFDRLALHHAAGVGFISINLGDACVPLDTQIRMAAHFRAAIVARPDLYVFAATMADVRRARAAGKLAVAFDVEGAWAMAGEVARVQVYARIGVRWLGLVFNRANWAGGGVHDARDEGLTAGGRALLDAMAAVGIVACVSHTGYRTAHDATQHQTQHGRPIVATHSNARALDDHPRNIPDDLIAAVAATGGVIGVNGLSIFLGGAGDLAARMGDHIEHIAAIAGAAHVGLGLDYVYDQADMDAQLAAARGTWPEGYGYEPGIRYLAPDALPGIVERLLARGWSDADVRGLLGENFARVAERVWR